MLEDILSSVFSAGTFNQMLRSATPVALAALGGAMTEHAGIMNIGMDGMILMGAFFGVLGSYLFGSAAAGIALVLLMGVVVGLFFALFTVKFRSDEFIIGTALNTFALGLLRRHQGQPRPAHGPHPRSGQHPLPGPGAQ